MIQLEDMLKAGGARLFGSVLATEFADFCFDSRRVERGQLFLAVRTEKGDGHDFILDAVRGGATGVLCQEPRGLDGHHVTCILVPDTERALIDWARAVLQRFGTEVIAVTGSVGKTGVKEAVAAVLGIHFPVFRNRGSFNGLYGLPIALGRLQPDHRLAVLELGSDHLGEIAELAALTRPTVGIVTAVSAAHLETLGSLEQIAEEKGALIRALPKAPDGLAILNWDDQLVRAMRDNCRARVISAGSQPGADLMAEGIRIGLDGTSFSISLDGEDHGVRIPWLGRQRTFAALTALAVGREYGIPTASMVEVLAELPWLPGRLNALPALNGATVLDDTFNSSPAAVKAALDFVAEVSVSGRKIAVLGDMYQLGERAVSEHRDIGRYAARVADRIIVKGELATEIGRGAEEAGFPPESIRYSYSTDDVIRHLLHTDPAGTSGGTGSEVGRGDLILVKGSAFTRLERVSRALLAQPERDQRRLVRQHPVFGQVILALPGRPTWVEIDVEATAHNVRRTREMIGPRVHLMVVIKADAYGHGASRIARVALSNGAEWLGVASLNEAIALRDAGIAAPVLVLGFSPAWSARQALLNEVAITIFDPEIAQAFNRAATELGRRATVHIKVDTGMGRLGLLPPDVLPFLRQLQSLSHLQVEGIFTHFSVADSAEPQHRDHTDTQLRRFRTLLSQLEAASLRPPLVHCANSAAILTRPETHFDMVRLGIALHGLDPSPEVRCPADFQRALSFKTTVAQVKRYPPGTPISYGNTYRTEHEQCIAVIPVGYADGFRRAPRHWGEVLVRGRRAPVVGRVTMDQTMIDVTPIPGVRIGDEVVLIGRQGDDEITAEEVAARLGTINYEVVSGILARVPRIA
jgi:alanine racemase